MNCCVPGTQEEEGDGGTLADVGRPRDGDGAADDDTVGVVDLAELVCCVTYRRIEGQWVNERDRVSVVLKCVLTEEGTTEKYFPPVLIVLCLPLLNGGVLFLVYVDW